MDLDGMSEDGAGFGRRGAQMRYRVGAEQLEQVLSLAHRPDGVFRVARAAPVGPTRAVDAATDAVACGIKADGSCATRTASWPGGSSPTCWQSTRAAVVLGMVPLVTHAR
jgi:hypothetical protein